MTDPSSSPWIPHVDRRDVLALLTATAAIGPTGFAGCVGDDDRDDELPDTVEVWAWDDPALASVREAQGVEFAEMHGVEFEWELVPFADYHSAMLTAIEEDDAPDSGAFSVLWIPSVGADGVLVDVVDAFDIDPNDFVEAAVKNATHDGTMVCVPWFQDCRFLGIDRDAFDTAGIQVPDRLETPALQGNFEAWLFELRDHVDGPAFVMDAREGFEALFLSNGGRYFDDAVTECTLNEPEVVEVATFIQRHVRAEETIATHSPAAPSDPIEDFLAGEIPMYYSGLWHHARLVDSGIDWQWNPVPVGPRSEASHTWSAGVYYGSPVDGGANLAAGQAWAEYITSAPVQTRIAPLTGLFPSTKAAYRTEEFAAYVEENPAMVTAQQEIELTVPFPDHPKIPSMREAMAHHAERMWFEGDDPQESLDALAETIDAML